MVEIFLKIRSIIISKLLRTTFFVVGTTKPNEIKRLVSIHKHNFCCVISIIRLSPDLWNYSGCIVLLFILLHFLSLFSLFLPSCMHALRFVWLLHDQIEVESVYLTPNVKNGAHKKSHSFISCSLSYCLYTKNLAFDVVLKVLVCTNIYFCALMISAVKNNIFTGAQK